MLDVLKKDPKASFFFIGAEDEKDEPGKTTRRFRVYHRFVSSVVSENVFEHHRNNGLSLYILVNKKYVEDIPLYTQKITDFVSEAMNREWSSLLYIQQSPVWWRLNLKFQKVIAPKYHPLIVEGDFSSFFSLLIFC